jgi:hypothetical protein
VVKTRPIDPEPGGTSNSRLLPQSDILYDQNAMIMSTSLVFVQLHAVAMSTALR